MTEPGSRSRADAYGTNRDPGVREFEEGVTEAYSYARLDRFISETGFDEIVPGIHDVRGRSTYPNVAPAALEVAEGIGDRTGLGAEEVLDRLNRVDHEEKWDVATDLMYESSDLPGMAADDRERDASKARIRDAMRDRFTDLGNLRVSRADGITEQDVRASSAEAGRAAIADANAEIDRMESSYRETGRILDRDLDVDDAPPTSASRVDRPTDRTPIQNPDPARTDTTDARDAVDRAGDGRESAERGDRQGDGPGGRQEQGKQQQGKQQQGQGAKEAAAAARNAAHAADAVIDEADPTSSSGSRRVSGRQSGSGLDPISTLRDLTHGGQRPAGEAARAPSEHPQARHHGRGVHSPAQHNQRLRDQHRPQRDQGEGIER